MIVFDLKCGGGHVFEAWFASSSAYEEQRARAIVACPHCGATDVVKAPMAPNIATNRAAPPDDDPAPLPASSGASAGAGVVDVPALLEALKTRIESDFDYVGADFAEEARKIHYGESDARPIYGEATASESRALLDEGISVLPLPFIRKHDA